MKLKRFLILCLSFFIFISCMKTVGDGDTIPVVESKEPFTIHFFYLKTCGHCKQQKEHLIPMIEEDFKDQVTIEYHEMDEEGSEDLYNTYIGLYDPVNEVWEIEGLLADVDPEIASHNYYAPLMVIGNYYAFMGYTDDYRFAYLQDIHLALKGKRLGTGDVSKGRYLFK